ncbi:MAG: ATP-binding cassette domain-containing protein, partial [Elusimicrobia bacterium]|nr:ATP-binding cassette domain-containing protein [Elusimicrobiota bacterium]
MAGPAPAVSLDGIVKRYPRVVANDGVSLKVARGSIHALVGENGAGKSTLMKILYGLVRPDEGTIQLDGKDARFDGPADAIAAGIGMVHQHFMLVGPMTVLENVTLGAEGGPLLARGAAEARAKLAELGAEYGLAVDPDAKVDDLPVGQQQRVEILKALVRGARTLVLDEPTAVLTPAETDRLFEMLRKMAAQGRTVLFITHKLREIMALTDRVSVMRRGEMVASFATKDTSPSELAEAMVGRKVLLRVEKAKAAPGRAIVEARDLTLRDRAGVARLDGVSLTLRAGEI